MFHFGIGETLKRLEEAAPRLRDYLSAQEQLGSKRQEIAETKKRLEYLGTPGALENSGDPEENLRRQEEYKVLLSGWQEEVGKLHSRSAELHSEIVALVQASEAYENHLTIQEQQSGNRAVVESRPVIGGIKELSLEIIAHLKTHHDDISKVPSGVFEHLVGEMLASQGFSDIHLVGSDPQTSADIFAAIKDPLGEQVRYFIEVKRWNRAVGIEVVNQVHGAMILERPTVGWHAASYTSWCSARSCPASRSRTMWISS